jgi:hypothetical protein
MIGIDPSDMTLRELVWALDGAWEPWAMINATVSCAAGAKAKPNDFHPLRQQ